MRMAVLASNMKCQKLQADRKSTRLNSSHGYISYAVFCLKKKNNSLAAATSTPLLPFQGLFTHTNIASPPLPPPLAQRPDSVSQHNLQLDLTPVSQWSRAV